MLHGLPSLQKLITQLKQVPFLASKNVYRVAMHFLQAEPEAVTAFCNALQHAKENIRRCVVCCNWTEQDDHCMICRSGRRDMSQICVVETWHDLYAIERGGEYSGRYHVLGGALSPLDGISPKDLTITQLVQRVDSGKISELIFATNPTPEGEATVSYILSQLKGRDIDCSRLASGMPTGGSLEYMDRATIHKAFAGRQHI